MDNAVCYSQYLVASLDILGIKERMCGADSLQILNAIRDEYETIIRDTHANDKEFSSPTWHEFKVFSDNIVMARKVNNRKEMEQQLHNIAGNILFLQTRLWCRHHLLLRGGIALGNFYIDDLIAFGPGLLEAYQLESKIAIYPRVILSPKLNEFANKWPAKTPLFSNDSDNYIFVDYFSFWHNRFPNEEDRKKHITFVELGLNNNECIRQKYSWMIEKIEKVSE